MKPEREVNTPSDGTIKFAVPFLSGKTLGQCLVVVTGIKVLIPIALRFPGVTSVGTASSLAVLMAGSPCTVAHRPVPWERVLEHSDGVCTSLWEFSFLHVNWRTVPFPYIICKFLIRFQNSSFLLWRYLNIFNFSYIWCLCHVMVERGKVFQSSGILIWNP